MGRVRDRSGYGFRLCVAPLKRGRYSLTDAHWLWYQSRPVYTVRVFSAIAHRLNVGGDVDEEVEEDATHWWA